MEDSSTTDYGLPSISTKTPGAATIGIGRKTFHALKTKDLLDNTTSSFKASSNEESGSNDDLNKGTAINTNSTTFSQLLNLVPKHELCLFPLRSLNIVVSFWNQINPVN